MPDNSLEMQLSGAPAATAQSDFDRFFETTPSPMIAAGFDGYMKRVNRACEQLAGFTAAELKAQPFSYFIHPEDREIAELAMLEIAASDSGQAIDIRILYKDGSYRWTQWTGTPFLDQGAFYLVGKDVTEQHLALQALEERVQADRDLENFFNNAPDVMFVGGYDGCIKRSNSALQALTGFTAEQLMAEPIVAFAHPDEREQVAGEVQKIIAGGITRSFELRVRCADGAYKRVVWNASNFAELGVFYAVGTDVTARRAAESALAERAKQQEAIAELGKLALAAADLPQLMHGAVELVARTLAVEFAEIRELSPDRRQTTLKAGVGWREGPLSQAPIGADPDTVSGFMLATDQPVVIEDLLSETRFHGSEMLREHGVTSGVGCVIHGPERPYGVLAAYSNRSRTFTGDDIRFLQAAANVLSAAINRQQAVDDFNRFFDSSPDLMIIAGFDGCVRRMNSPAGTENYLTPEDVRNQPLLSFVHPEDKEIVARELENLFVTGTTKPFEARSLMKDGSYDWFSWSATAFPDRQILYAVGQNTTARRRAEEELRRFFENSPDVLAICGFDGSLKRINPACLTISGFTAEDVAQMSSFLDTVHPDDRASGAAEMQKLRAGGKLSGYEIRGLNKDGSYNWVSWNITAFPDSQDYYITGHIVTERHIAEETLRQRARQQEAVAQLGGRSLAASDLAAIMADACVVLAQTLDMEYAEILELLPGEGEFLLKAGYGWSEDQIGSARVSASPEVASGYILSTKQPLVVDDSSQDMRFLDLPLLKEQQAASGMGCLILAAESPYGVLGVHSSRRRTFSENDVHFLEAVANILAAAIERKRSEGQIERFFDRTPSPMVIIGFDGSLKYANLAAVDFTGLTREELYAHPYFQVFHPDDVERAGTVFPELFSGKSLHDFEVRIRFKDGSYRWFAGDLQPDLERQLVYIITRDVEDRHAAEAALAERARQQEAVVELGNRSLATSDLPVLMADATEVLAKTLGMEYAEILELLPGEAEFLLTAGYGWREDQNGSARVSASPENASGYVLTTKEPLVVEDLAQETRFRGAPLLKEHQAASGMGCLISAGERPYGVLGVHSRMARKFSDDDVHFLEAVANILAAAIARKQSEGALERFFDRTPSPMVVVGFDGAFKYANPAAVEYTGLSRDELFARPFFDIFDPQDIAPLTNAFPELLAGKALQGFEVRIRSKEGGFRWYAGDLQADPERQLLYVIAHDVDDRHAAQDALAERARQQQAVVELGNRALATSDLAAVMSDAADMLAKTLGMEYAEILELRPGEGEFVLKAGHGWREDQLGSARVSAAPENAGGYILSTRQPLVVDDWALENRVHEAPLLQEHQPASGMGCLISAANRPYGVLGVHASQRRKFSDNDLHFLEAVANILAAAIERRQREEERSLLFDFTSTPILILGLDGGVKYLNPAAYAISGYSPDDFRSQPFLSFVHPDDVARVEAVLPSVFAGQALQHFELRIRCKDESYKWFSLDANLAPDGATFYVIGTDVTARRSAEASLVERAQQQEAVAESGRLALANRDLTDLFHDVATRLAQTLGVEYSEVLELQPDGREFVLKAGVGWQQEQLGLTHISAGAETVSGYLLATSAPVVIEDLQHETRFQGAPPLHEQGMISGMACLIPGVERPYGVLGVHSPHSRLFSENDIHFLEAVANVLAAAIARKRSEQERERFFDRTLAPMLIIGFDGVVKYANPAATIVSGHSREELCSSPYLSFVHPDDAERTAATLPELMADKSYHAFEVRIRCKDGSYRWFAFDSSPDLERQAFYAIVHDVTDRHLAEEALAGRARQQEAIAALGGRALAGGELSALLNDAAAVLARTLDAEFSDVFEMQPGGKESLLTAGYGWPQEQLGQVRASAAADDGSVRLLTDRTSVIIDELHPESPFPDIPQFAEQKSASGMACLIQASGRPWGILGIRSTRRRTFNDNDLHFVEAVGNILSSAIERQRAEEELNRFIEPSLNPMYIAGFDGMIKRCNHALEFITGFTRDELMARSIWHFVHRDDRRAILAASKEIAVGRAAQALELRLACKDGSYIWTVWNCTSFPDWQVFYATGYDVSDLHAVTDALHERARQQQAVAELGARALSGADLQSLFDETVAAVSRTLQVEFATFLELLPDGREFALKAGYGWRPELIGKVRVPAHPQFLGGYQLTSEAPVLVENVWTEQRFHPHPLVAAHAITSEMACVVPGRPRPRGVLCVHSAQARRFQESEVLFLQAAANTLAAAIDRRRAEEELKRFVEPSLNPMFIGTFDGTLKECNHATELLTGYSRDEMRGRPIAAFVHPDDRQTVAAEVVKVATGESAHAFSVRIVAKDDSLKWTIWNATSFPEWEEFYATGQDVTEQHLVEEELRASEEMLEATDNSALDGIVLIDGDGNVVHWNAAAEKIFGYSAEEICGRNLHHTLVPPELREKFKQGWPHFQQTGTGTVIGKVLELEALRKNGSRFPVEVSVAAVSLHGRWNAVGVIRDITTRKQQEAELIAAKQTAEAANRAKSDFLANMSHEIRTPMNGVIGLTSLVLDTELNAEQRQYLDGVMLSAEALLKIINDILDFSKIEAGRLELERIDFDLREAVGNTMRTLALRAHQKNLELIYNVRPEAPDALVGDPARLWQVIVNLVGNAVKFTDQGEVSLAVAVETLQEHAVCLHFTVSDTGIGIPADKQQTLFKPFSQVDTSMARKYGGTGLGLAISAQIVDMMKGRIWFESELGKGSQFHFTAWFDRRSTPIAKRAPLPPSALDNLRVLVVDDNATNRTILRDMLTHWGMRPVEVERGPAALESLQAAFQAGDPFGLILLDVMMPEMDGFEVLERIRQIPEIDRPVIMMLSSRDEPGDAARARELGAAAYIIKPIRPSELLDAIVKALDISFETAALKTPAAPVKAAPRGPSLRILVAEDNPINQMLAVRMLEKAGHNVAKANNGQEVLAALGDECFDLVLMDVQMPVMDGFEATALIRQQEKQTGRHLPIVAMTAHAMKGDREKCLAAGMDGYVAKPVQRDELFAAIADAVQTESSAPISQASSES